MKLWAPNRVFSKTLGKFTGVGIVCTFFSMVSYPLILNFCNSETATYLIATASNITFSYVAQSIFTFKIRPTIKQFLRYIYVSLTIILVGNLIYFILNWIFKNGLLAYYASWIFTSAMSFIGHYKYTFRN